jgi:dienelactone hydrolase
MLTILRNLLIIATVISISCNNAGKDTTESADSTGATAKSANEEMANIKEEPVTYSADTVTMNGYITYDSKIEGKLPVVLVVPEWWGLVDYTRSRAKQLAELGYLAMAIDLYGNGKTADNPTDAQALSMPFYQNPQMAYKRFMAALQKIKENPKADTTKVAAVGYCFGGGMLLNVARLGANLKGVVSFHGGLVGTPVKKNLLKADMLVCHGDADPFVPAKDVEAFKKSMDSIKAHYTFKSYPGAMHAFTNPAATEIGKKYNLPLAYNAAADSASWIDMKEFFGRIFN